MFAETFTLVTPDTLDPPACRDRDDHVVLATAVAGECAAIITGDVPANESRTARRADPDPKRQAARWLRSGRRTPRGDRPPRAHGRESLSSSRLRSHRVGSAH